MKTPAVSVILTTYNRTRFLREALDSILTQTLRDFELILVDDGSPGTETAAIAQEYTKCDNRVRFLRQQENQGSSAARNAGLRLARAPYIALMDDDDISEVQRLEVELDYLEGNPEVAAVSCLSSPIDEQGRFLRRDSPSETLLQNAVPHLDRNQRQIYDNTDSMIRRITRLVGCAYPQSFVFLGAYAMIRRTALLEIGAYNEYFRFFEDLDLTMRMEEHYPLAKLGQPLYRWRMHKGKRLTTTRSTRFWMNFCAATLATYERRCGRPDPICSSSLPKDWLQQMGAMPLPLRTICVKVGSMLIKALIRTKSYAKVRALLPELRLVCGIDQEGEHLYRKVHRHTLIRILRRGGFGYWFAESNMKRNG